MILIDDNKTVIAGEALRVIAELAMVVDRLVLELSDKKHVGLTYDDLVERFASVVYAVQGARGDSNDISPQEILDKVKLKELFPEDFWKTFGSSSSKSKKSSSGKISENSASDMLAEAMAKLNRTKKDVMSDDAPKKKKKKNKNKKKD
jgi:hypothetical protein